MTSSPGTRHFVLTTLVVFTSIILLFTKNPAGKTQLEADRLEITQKQTVARGNVQLTHPDWSVKSDYLLIEKGKEIDTITAEGDVWLSYGEFTVNSDRLSGSLTTGDPSKLRELKLFAVQGESNSLLFQGEELTLETREGEINRVKVEGKAELSTGENSRISGDKILLSRAEEDWNLEVTGEANYAGDPGKFRAEGMRASIETDSKSNAARVSRLTAESTAGWLELKKANEKDKQLQIEAGPTTVDFGPSSNLAKAQFTDGTFTTCERCQVNAGCAYSITASHTSLVEGELILARSARLNTFGLPIWWAPLYLITVKNVGLPERPYFPQVGYSWEDGLSLSGAVPVYLDKNHFGSFVVDYFSRPGGLGLGVDFYSGGSDFAGLAEIYGSYRLQGTNYLKAEWDLDWKLRDWLSLKTEVDYQKGEFRGTEYDKNQWRLEVFPEEWNPTWNLTAARVEKEETDEDVDETITHVIERYPEISFTWQDPVSWVTFRTELNSGLGYFRENKSHWSQIRSAWRGELGGKFSEGFTLTDQFSLTLNGEGKVNQYFEREADDSSTRVWGNLRPGLRVKGPGILSVSFNHQVKVGQSPFNFDSVERLDRVAFDFQSHQGGINQSLNFHYDFVPDDGFSDIKYTLDFSWFSVDQTIGLTYDAAAGFLESVRGKSSYSWNSFRTSLSTGYNFADESISETTLSLGFAGAENQLEFKVVSEPPDRWLKEVSTEIDLTAFDNWSFSLNGKYDFQKGKVSGLSYSIHNTLQNCVKLGFRGDKSGVWFDVELVGF
ncbi:hypothetical protein KGY77_10635 [Candidatus Bipolaricaulota bacterium]|nr:hypothetical protein [Candidatus Bipolaricaulota bacterium]